VTVCIHCGHESPEAFKFCPECGAPTEEAAPTREVRKVVTIVFCDLTGSTALGHRTDPEALRATMRGYYEEMRSILERHGGTAGRTDEANVELQYAIERFESYGNTFEAEQARLLLEAS
jgi:class 3 adenylate cyclase